MAVRQPDTVLIDSSLTITGKDAAVRGVDRASTVLRDLLGRVPTWSLCGALFIVWFGFFGASVEGALARLVDPESFAGRFVSLDEQIANFQHRLVVVASGLMLVGVVLAVRKYFGFPLPKTVGSAADATRLWAAALVFAFLVGYLVASTSVIAPWMDVSDSTALTQMDYEHEGLSLASSLIAGAVEEPMLAALPVLLLAGRMPISVIVVLGGAMRGLLHLYYGGHGFVWAFIWGGAAVWIYYRYRRLWLLIALHGFVLNVHAVALLPATPDWLAVAITLFKTTFLVGFGVWWLRRNWDHFWTWLDSPDSDTLTRHFRRLRRAKEPAEK